MANNAVEPDSCETLPDAAGCSQICSKAKIFMEKISPGHPKMVWEALRKTLGVSGEVSKKILGSFISTRARDQLPLRPLCQLVDPENSKQHRELQGKPPE